MGTVVKAHNQEDVLSFISVLNINQHCNDSGHASERSKGMVQILNELKRRISQSVQTSYNNKNNDSNGDNDSEEHRKKLIKDSLEKVHCFSLTYTIIFSLLSHEQFC